MPKFQFVLFISFLLGSSFVFAQNDDFIQRLKPFISISKGGYEQRVEGDEFTEREQQPQDLVFFPLWTETQTQWFYFAWINPKEKERPLGCLFLEVQPFDADSAKINFYDLPEGVGNSLEWRNAQPFAELNPEILRNEQIIGTGFLLLNEQKDDYWTWHTSVKLPRHTKTAPYNFVELDCRFYNKQMSVWVVFSRDEKVVLEQRHYVPLMKKHKNVKTY